MVLKLPRSTRCTCWLAEMVFMYKHSTQGTEQWLMANDRATNITCDTGNSKPICAARNNTFDSKLCGLFVQQDVLSVVF